MRKLEKKLKIDCNELQVELPWKDKDGNHRYDSFILEVERPVTAQDEEVSQFGEKRKRQARQPTDLGALYHDYSRDVHEWLTDLRRVHFNNPPATINGKVVTATYPLAPPGESLYYVHSKTAYYNSFCFEFSLSSRPLVWCIHFTSTARGRTLKICLILKFRGMQC